MRILLTNDDGLDCEGIHHLARALEGCGAEIVIAAPSEDLSGSGAAIGPIHLRDGVEVYPAEVPDLPGISAFKVDGPPGLAVLLARLGALGEPPELVVSGINPGNNTGRSVLHSGTVGAALTAHNFGGAGLAISLQTPADGSEVYRWHTAAYVARRLVDAILPALPQRLLLNVNVPDKAIDEIVGWRRTRLAAFGTVRAAVTLDEPDELGRRRIGVTYRRTEEVLKPDTDTASVLAGLVSITWLDGIGAVADDLACEAEITRALDSIATAANEVVEPVRASRA